LESRSTHPFKIKEIRINKGAPAFSPVLSLLQVNAKQSTKMHVFLAAFGSGLAARLRKIESAFPRPPRRRLPETRAPA
jgi:hypothetical protein